uniref:Serine/threonine-protein phosphatase n=1 Tax=Caenorhabditis japonica TaxID=281687 RepID=A0A8R1INX3_CAEJA
MGIHTNIFEGETVDQLAQRMIDHILKWKSLDAFTNHQVNQVLDKVESVLKPLPAMLQLEHPITVVGDIHGQLDALIRYFDVIGYPPNVQFLFLGDYVDRGAKSLETSMLLFCYKIRHSQMIHLLRGNHECMKMNRLYGFHEELVRKRDSTCGGSIRGCSISSHCALESDRTSFACTAASRRLHIVGVVSRAQKA